MRTAMKLVERLLEGEEVLAGAKPSEMHARLASALKSTAGRIVDILLAEASVSVTPGTHREESWIGIRISQS